MPVTLKIVSDAEQRMRALADAMYAGYAEFGEFTETMGLRQGFSRFELETLGDGARALAEKRRIRVDDSPEGFTWSDDDVIAIFDANCVGLTDIGDVVAVLRRRGVPLAAINRTWPRLSVKIATAIATMPASAIGALQGAVA